MGRPPKFRASQANRLAEEKITSELLPLDRTLLFACSSASFDPSMRHEKVCR